jgi:hypothetical protein
VSTDKDVIEVSGDGQEVRLNAYRLRSCEHERGCNWSGVHMNEGV